MTPFVTLTELAAMLSPRAPRNLSEDVLAQIAIEAASDAIRTHTEQRLELVEDDTEIFSGTGTARELILPELPVVEVDEVRVGIDGSDLEVLLDWVLLDSGMLRPGPDADFTLWPEGEANIEVDYTHGYVVDDASAYTLPGDLRMLALTLAARAYHQGIARQEATGSSSITYSVAASIDLSAGEKAICAKYRHPKAPTVAAASQSS